MFAAVVSPKSCVSAERGSGNANALVVRADELRVGMARYCRAGETRRGNSCHASGVNRVHPRSG